MEEQGDLLEYLLVLDERRRAQQPADGSGEELELIGPHVWCRGRWRPVVDGPGIDSWTA